MPTISARVRADLAAAEDERRERSLCRGAKIQTSVRGDSKHSSWNTISALIQHGFLLLRHDFSSTMLVMTAAIATDAERRTGMGELLTS